jgi:hypothetical protein
MESELEKSNLAAVQRLERISQGTRLLHRALDELWEDKRMVVVRGFSNVVRQHATAQWLLIQNELDVSATALVRPTYETTLRAIWAFRGAEDAWIEEFLSPVPAALISDAETRMGPDVNTMLRHRTTSSRFHSRASHRTQRCHMAWDALLCAWWDTCSRSKFHAVSAP